MSVKEAGKRKMEKRDEGSDENEKVELLARPLVVAPLSPV